MTTLKTTIKIIGDRKGIINFQKSIRKVMTNTGKRLAFIGEHAAKTNYMTKRKTKKMPSMVFGSFTYGGTISTPMSVESVVFAGGSKAPWTIYVDQDRSLRNGKMWSSVNPNAPYMFMKAGARRSIKEIPRIVKEEMSKIKMIRVV